MRYTPVIENRTEQGLYQEEMEIKFCQCDASHRLKLSELFRILTDMADSAFAFRGMDHQFLMENRMVFLITRFSVLVNRMPVQTERVRVATWEQQIERAQFIRNFCSKFLPAGYWSTRWTEASCVRFSLKSVFRGVCAPPHWKNREHRILYGCG